MNKFILPLIALPGLLLLGCENDTSNGQERHDSQDLGGETLATVDGEAISDELFKAFVRQMPNADLDTMEENQREQFIDHLINLHILTRKAEQRGLDKDPDVIAQLIIERQQTLAEAYIRDEVATDDAVQAAYDERYDESLEVRARHILVREEDLARELIGRLQDGEDFAELAEEYSEDRGGVDGGDLGWFPPEQMVQPFAEAVSNMEVGELTEDPVETDFGWHVILLEDSRVQRPPLEEVRGDIINTLIQERAQGIVNEAREGADVQR